MVVTWRFWLVVGVVTLIVGACGGSARERAPEQAAGGGGAADANVGGEAGQGRDAGGAGVVNGGQAGATRCAPFDCADLDEQACLAHSPSEHSDGCVARYGAPWPRDASSERQYAGCAPSCCNANGSSCPGFPDAEACVANELGECWTISSPPAPTGWRLLAVDSCEGLPECAAAGGGAPSAGIAGEGGGGSMGGAAGAAGAGAIGGSGGDGGDGGVCKDDVAPQSLPSCQLTNDETPCRACLKTRCCASWQACYEEPRGACGYGPKQDDLGQFDCMRSCYDDVHDGVKSMAEILETCEPACIQPCERLTDITLQIIDCALNGVDGEAQSGVDDCLDVCFPPG